MEVAAGAGQAQRGRRGTGRRDAYPTIRGEAGRAHNEPGQLWTGRRSGVPIANEIKMSKSDGAASRARERE